MKQIHYTATHTYYDGILLFEARDSGGSHYIASAIDRQEKYDRYLLKKVPLEALRRFRTGGTDLKSLLLEAPGDDWYVASLGGDPEEPLRLERHTSPLIETDYLPERGLVLHDHPSDDEIVETARKENTLVVEIRADSRRAEAEHRVTADTLAGILSRFRTLVRYSQRRATEPYDWGMGPVNGELLEVLVPAAHGSSRVLLASTRSTDYLGGSFLKPAFRYIDTVFERAEDPAGAVAHLHANRGHFAGATLKLLRFLNRRHTDLRYVWADQNSDDSRHLGVSQEAAARIVEASAKVPEITTETVALTGKFQKFDRRTGVWGLLTEDGPVGGRLRERGPDLDGLEVGRRYRFVCEERIEATRVSRKDTPTRILVSHEPASD